MQFISIYFCLFMVMVLIGYYNTPVKYRYIFILVCNLLYYATLISDIKYFFSLIAVTLITYVGARLLTNDAFTEKSRRVVLYTVIVLTVGSLVYFKYTKFFANNWNYIIEFLNLPVDNVYFDIVMPMGISFYTFQALGYVIDVYRGKIQAEYNFCLYFTYVSFFPTITSGPIERADSLLMQLKCCERKKFSFVNMEKGIVLILWGAFVKLVIADRLVIIVDTVFGEWEKYGGFILFVSAIAYTLQIYCDFASYSLIAIGIGKLVGIDIRENFNAPYFSKNIQEFWRRWHISLSTWFRDYVYISLGGNRCSKVRKNVNLFVTFLVSGLWHGANWTFVVWGVIHGIYQIVGNVTVGIRDKIYKKINIDKSKFSFQFGSMLATFLLVSFAWIFFRADSVSDAFGYVGRMIMTLNLWDVFNLKIYDLGLSTLQMNVLGISLACFVFVDWLKYKTQLDVGELLVEQNWIFKGMVVIILFIAVFVFGMYGPEFNSQEFIYFQF